MEFVTPEGTTVPLKSLGRGKRLVVVVTRGATTPICPYCSTQVAQLISNYSKFESRNAEVAVIYPVNKPEGKAALAQFLEVAKSRLRNPKSSVPFPILFDVELKAVDQLGIRQDLSKPATFILDAEGQIQFAYVGAMLSDRPSIKAMLEQLDALSNEAR